MFTISELFQMMMATTILFGIGYLLATWLYGHR